MNFLIISDDLSGAAGMASMLGQDIPVIPFSNIEKSYDYKGEILSVDLETRNSTDLFRLSKLHNITFSIFVKRDENEDKYYFEAFIAKESIEENLAEIIKSYSPVESEWYYMISRPVISTKILDLMKELWDVPSVQFSEITVEDGKLILRIRYHSLYKKDVSLVLNKYLAIPYFIDDLLMKKSEDVIF